MPWNPRQGRAALDDIRNVMLGLGVVRPVEGDRRLVVVDGHVDLPARGHLDPEGGAAPTGEQTDDQFVVDVQEELRKQGSHQAAYFAD